MQNCASAARTSRLVSWPSQINRGVLMIAILFMEQSRDLMLPSPRRIHLQHENTMLACKQTRVLWEQHVLRVHALCGGVQARLYNRWEGLFIVCVGGVGQSASLWHGSRAAVWFGSFCCHLLACIVLLTRCLFKQLLISRCAAVDAQSSQQAVTQTGVLCVTARPARVAAVGAGETRGVAGHLEFL